jgi:sulfite reductase (NADPH) flavoprotein alpha-component
MSTTAQTYTKENPFLTDLLVNEKLNKEGSQKDTRHFEISLKGSDIEYIPGDSLYVFPENEEALVNQFLDSVELVKSREEEFERFTKEVNITRASTKLFKLIQSKSEKAADIDAKDLAAPYEGYNIPNIIKDAKEKYGISFTTDEIAENSSKLMARAYSIASSLKAHPDEVHLCIARVDEEINGQKVLGVCSNFLSERVELNGKNIRVYLHVNERFRLPEKAETDIIMVGPGTGIAPFRAFIEERNYQRDNGENVGKDWLFFGDQRAAFDYLYGEEFTDYETKYGLKVTTAFSRDQEEKVYVQHRMLEHADEIFKMLEAGAHFYVCGDARRMAKDVDSALREIAQNNGKDADEYMKALKDQGRYQRDIY